ncbi:PREDICTED: 40S ribosomal protein S13 [Aptenodytes forsteri]|uniref:40S ribosomal protein S13 n=1 Tax=Aptenodytes forsteri TaxID=9233 RepID=UPI0004F40B13|nr:PREDICTED: 40S ribosomal protein S13 [Aptenodytes forsteri]
MGKAFSTPNTKNRFHNLIFPSPATDQSPFNTGERRLCRKPPALPYRQGSSSGSPPSPPLRSVLGHCDWDGAIGGETCDLLLPHRKGLSQSALPYRRSVPTWLKLTSDDVKEQIYKLAKKGLTPSQIGVILRDSHGVAQVRFVTGNKILRILKSKGLAPDLPEDLYHLIKKAVAVRKHLERNRKDKDAKFRLILIESRIHRLARYYKTKRVLPPNWKYESSTASALVA